MRHRFIFLARIIAAEAAVTPSEMHSAFMTSHFLLKGRFDAE
jgi:hypothetical protein